MFADVPAFLVAYDESVAVHGFERMHGIEQRFALGRRRTGDIEIDHVRAEPLRGQIERGARACGRLEEQIDDGAPGEQVQGARAAVAFLAQCFGAVEQAHDVRARQTVQRGEMTQAALGIELDEHWRLRRYPSAACVSQFSMMISAATASRSQHACAGLARSRGVRRSAAPLRESSSVRRRGVRSGYSAGSTRCGERACGLAVSLFFPAHRQRQADQKRLRVPFAHECADPREIRALRAVRRPLPARARRSGDCRRPRRCGARRSRNRGR